MQNTPKTIEQRVDWKPAFKKGFVWEQDGNRGLQFFRITSEVDWEKHPDKEKLIGTRTLVQPEYLEAFIEQVITEQDRISRESEKSRIIEQVKNSRDIIPEIYYLRMVEIIKTNKE